MPSKQPIFCVPHLSCLASLSLLHLTHRPTLLDKTLRAGHSSKRPGGEITELNDADLVGSVPQGCISPAPSPFRNLQLLPMHISDHKSRSKSGSAQGSRAWARAGLCKCKRSSRGVGGFPRLPFRRRLPRLPGVMHQPTTTGLSPGRSATQGVFGHQPGRGRSGLGAPGSEEATVFPFPGLSSSTWTPPVPPRPPRSRDRPGE